jgi:hypothetical protein
MCYLQVSDSADGPQQSCNRPCDLPRLFSGDNAVNGLSKPKRKKLMKKTPTDGSNIPVHCLADFNFTGILYISSTH